MTSFQLKTIFFLLRLFNTLPVKNKFIYSTFVSLLLFFYKHLGLLFVSQLFYATDENNPIESFFLGGTDPAMIRKEKQ